MSEREVAVKLTARVDAYLREIDKARQGTENFSKQSVASIEKLGGQMQKVGGWMSTRVTLPIVAAGGAATAAAVSWESSWAGVTKTVSGSTQQMANLEKGLRGMAQELPATHKEIAAVAEAAGQLGVGIDSIESFTRVMIDLGETTNLTADEAATSIAQLMNVMGTAPQDVGRLGASLVALGNAGASTERDIIQMAQRIAGAASVIGLSEAEVMGFANALASAGIEVEAGGTAISTVMIDMAKQVQTSGANLETFAQVAGMSAAEFSRAFKDDPASAIAAFTSGLGEMQAAGGNVFGVLDQLGLSDVRVSRALLSMAQSGDLLTDSLATGAQAWGENTALADEAAKRYETSAAKFAIMRNQIMDVAIELGEVLLPAALAVVGGIRDLVKWIGDLPAPLKYAAIGFVGLVGAAGPVINITGTLMKNFGNIASAAPRVATAIKGVGAAMGVAGIALTAGVAIYAAMEDEKRKLRQATDEFTAALNAEAQGQKDATLALISAKIASSDLIEQGAALGLSAQNVVDIINGESVPAWEKYKEVIGSSEFQTGSYEQKMTLLGRQFGTSGKDVRNFAADVGEIAIPLALARDETAALAETNRLLGVSTGEAGGATIDFAGLLNDAATGIRTAGVAADDAGTSTAGWTEKQRDNIQALFSWDRAMDAVDNAVDDATNALERHISALQADLEAQQALVDFARAAADSQFAVQRATDEWNRALEELHPKIAEINKSSDSQAEKQRQISELYRSAVDDAAAMADAGVKAYDDAANGALTATQKGDLFRQSMLDQAEQAKTTDAILSQGILDYIFQVEKIPPEKQTAIRMYVEAGLMDEANQLLNETSATRTAEVQADVDEAQVAGEQAKLDRLEDPLKAKVTVTADTSAAQKSIGTLLGQIRQISRGVDYDKGLLPGNASGTDSWTGGLTWVGERGKELVILPKGSAIVPNHQLRDIPEHAVGTRNFTILHTTIPASTLGTGGGESLDAQVKRRQFERGELGADAYLADLEKRRQGLTLYSDEEDRIWKEIQSIKAQTAEADRKAADDAAKLAQEQIDHEDAVMKWRFEHGEIDLAQYEEYLKGRQGKYEVYSTEWFRLTREMEQVQADALAEDRKRSDAALAAEEKAIKESLDRIAKLYDEARNRKSFADAAADVDAAMADLAAAAPEDVADATMRAAEALYRRADAGANAAGIADNTPEWGVAVRAALEGDKANAPGLAAAIDRILIGIPSFAVGGHMPARVGGHIVRVAEAGQGEHMVPDSDMAVIGKYLSTASMMTAAQGSGGVTHVHNHQYTFELQTLATDETRLVQELERIIGNNNRRNGRSTAGLVTFRW